MLANIVQAIASTHDDHRCNFLGARLWVTRETTRVFFALTISFVLQNRLLCETQVWKRVRLAMAFSFPRPYNHKFTKEREGVAWCTIPRACPSPACGRGALLRHAFVALRATWLPVRYRGSALHVVVVDSCYRVAPGSPQDSQFDRDAYLQSLANEVLLAVRASVASSAASHVPHWQARCRSTTRPVSMTPVRAHRSACALGP